MSAKIQFRRDTSTNWQNENPILSNGEIGLDTTNKKIKIGNGVDTWNNLVYYPDIASQADAEAGTDQNKLMTPLRTAEAIASLAPDPEIASTAEAEAGVINDKFMTPLRTKEAIIELSPPPVIADQTQAEEGTNNETFMTPLRTAQAISSIVNFDTLSSTLTSANWTGSSEPYTQVINVSGIENTDNIFVDLDFSGITVADDIKAVRDSWTLVYFAETGSGTITFKALDIPQYDIPLQIRRGNNG